MSKIENTGEKQQEIMARSPAAINPHRGRHWRRSVYELRNSMDVRVTFYQTAREKTYFMWQWIKLGRMRPKWAFVCAKAIIQRVGDSLKPSVITSADSSP